MTDNSNSAKIAAPVTVSKLSVTAVSSAEIVLSTYGAGWYSLASTGTTTYVVFAAKDEVPTATTSNAYPIPADQERSFYVGSGMAFRYIGAGTGDLHLYRSGG
jgi:hypothetical protein